MLINWGILYYMVFEMKYIIATLESETHLELIAKRKSLKTKKIIIFTIYTAIYAPISIFVFIGLREYS